MEHSTRCHAIDHERVEAVDSQLMNHTQLPAIQIVQRVGSANDSRDGRIAGDRRSYFGMARSLKVIRVY